MTHPRLRLMIDGVVRTVTARLIVGADGRDSQVARLGGFERRADPDELLAAGLLVQGEMDTGDAVNMFIGQAAGQIAAVTRIAPEPLPVLLLPSHRRDPQPSLG